MARGVDETGLVMDFWLGSFPGENARSWEALGEARPGQSSHRRVGGAYTHR